MAVNLSDIAAMAGRPIAAVVGLVVPRSGNPTLIHELNAGLHEVAERFQVPIVGGDTNSWEGGLVVSVTVLGESEKPILRSGAQPGDALFVTGTLGGSILGRHLDPQPRISEALQLRSLVPLHALIDISDGLSQDLGHILSESGCGAILDAEAIPLHPDATTLSQTSGKSPLEHALGDGEDFELILVVSPEDAERLTAQPVPGITLSRIGTCVREPGMWLQESGKLVPLMPRGWNHPLS
jgi:thiamine-monophosphate kinase